jgi:flagella basal body P-ring formation protein FlgA
MTGQRSARTVARPYVRTAKWPLSMRWPRKLVDGAGPAAASASVPPAQALLDGSARRRRDRQLRTAIALAIVALVIALANRVWAEPLETIVRAKLAPMLPAGLDVARVYLPAGLAKLDVDRSKVAIELPRELRAGRPSIKLTVRGRTTTWVPVAIGVAVDVAIAQRELAAGDVIGDADVAIERRAIADFAPAAAQTLVGASVTAAIAAGAPIGARDISLPPPLARGTQVTIDLRRGAVHVRGTGVLEAAARPGEPASARLTATKLVVHGTLAAPATLIIGDMP